MYISISAYLYLYLYLYIYIYPPIYICISYILGVWRSAYKVDSIGEVSVIIHFLGGPKMFLYVAYAILIGLAALAAMLLKKFEIINM